jgi:N-formylglutamate deformylase
MKAPVSVTRGNSPLVLAIPHAGTWLPAEVGDVLNERGRQLADTDWHVDRLYADLMPGATIIRAEFHRYVIDANRDPGGASLYPGQNSTGLCPVTDFDGRAIYRDGCEPRREEIERRRLAYHAPYHAAIAAELERARARHGVAVLYDCHSIRSRIPFLFDGVLPDFNVGTNGGATCAPEMEKAVMEICAAAKGYQSILNGRFRGGWTTRHHGRPHEGWHAIQMELAQSAYLETEAAPFAYSEEKAERLRPILKTILEILVARARDLSVSKEA